jgi:outer membrane receptor for ferrienterochelin and colicin
MFIHRTAWGRLPRAPRVTAWLLSAAIAAVFPARADTDLTTLSLEQLLAVKIVGASKYEQSARDIAASVSVITREDIRTFGWRTLDEALASLPGVHITYDRQYHYLGARGFGLPGDYNTRVLVMIDGNRVNDVIYDSAPPGPTLPLDLDLVQRIEFIAGPGGAVYGQNAMFGVVNIVTREGASVNGARVAATWQEPQARREGRLSWGRRFDSGLDLLLSVSATHQRGEDRFYDYGAAGVAGVAQGQDGARDRELFVRAGRGPLSMGLVAGRYRKDDPTGVFFSDPLVPGQYQEDGYGLAQVQYHDQLDGGRLDVSARLFAGRSTYRSRLVIGTPFEYPADGRWHGAELRMVSTDLAQHTLMLGLEAQADRSVQRVNDLADPAASRSVTADGYRAGIYAQDDWRISDAFSATLGLRVDRNDRTGTKTSPRAALIWRAAPATTFKVLAGRAQRAPNAYEQDYADDVQAANPALAGERIDTTELSVDQRWGDGWSVRGAAYRWIMRDLVVLGVDAQSQRTQYRSGGQVQARGAELSLDKAWAHGARLRANLSLQHVRDAAGAWLVNSPRRLAKLSYSTPWAAAGLRVGYEFNHESERLTLAGARVGARSLSNVSVGSDRWWPGLDLSLAVRNLFDKRYAQPLAESNWQDAIEQDGRSLRLMARYAF